MWLLIEKQGDYNDYYILKGIYRTEAGAIFSAKSYEDNRDLAVAEVTYGEVDLDTLAQPELDRKREAYYKKLELKRTEEGDKIIASHTSHTIQEMAGKIVCLTCVKVYAWCYDHYSEVFEKDFNTLKEEKEREKKRQQEVLDFYKRRLDRIKEDDPDSPMIPLMEAEMAEIEGWK